MPNEEYQSSFVPQRLLEARRELQWLCEEMARLETALAASHAECERLREQLAQRDAELKPLRAKCEHQGAALTQVMNSASLGRRVEVEGEPMLIVYLRERDITRWAVLAR